MTVFVNTAVKLGNILNGNLQTVTSIFKISSKTQERARSTHTQHEQNNLFIFSGHQVIQKATSGSSFIED